LPRGESCFFDKNNKKPKSTFATSRKVIFDGASGVGKLCQVFKTGLQEPENDLE
jgi:hypothetical protein